MATQTVLEQSKTPTAAINLRKVADISRNANLDKFAQDSSDEEYATAVELIKTRFNSIRDVKAIFSIDLGANQPHVIIDTRSSPKIVPFSEAAAAESTATVFIRPYMVQQFVDGIIEPRYALNWGHIFVEGTIKVGMKFCDALGPFDPIHPPKIDMRDLPVPTEDIAQVKKDLKEYGYGLIKNALSPEELKRLQVRLKEQAAGEAEAGVGSFDGGENAPNQRVWALANKGQEFIDLLDHNPTFDQFVPEFLGVGAHLFSYTANIAKPGNVPMNLHTDQITIQPPVRSVAFGLNFIFFLTDITATNGGTLVMPGSHKGNVAPDDPYDASDCVNASGPAGTCMVFESRIWHGTGANITPGSERPVLIVFFMRSFVRSQENWFLSLRDDVLAGLSDRVKGFLGFRSVGSMGGVQGRTKDGTIVEKAKNPIGRLAPSSPASNLILSN